MTYTHRVLNKITGARRRIQSFKKKVVQKIIHSKHYIAYGDQLFRLNNKRASSEEYFFRRDGQFKKLSDDAVIIHLYYVEGWDKLFRKRLIRLALKVPFDLYVTIPVANTGYIPVIRKHFSQANILIVPNRGRDVLPFIKTALLLDKMGYKKVLKLHSKKSSHRDNEGTTAESGEEWLEKTLDALIPSDMSALNKVVMQLKDPMTGMIGASDYYYPLKMYLSHNIVLIRRIIKAFYPDLLSGMIAPKLDNFSFFGGTMFWVDLAAIRDVLPVAIVNFESETGQTDGTMAHAFERVLCMSPQIKNMHMYGMSGAGLALAIRRSFPEWYYDDTSGGKPHTSIIVPVYADWSSLSKNIKSLIGDVGDADNVSVHYVNDCGPDADMLEKKIVDHIQSITNFYYYRNEKNLGFIQTCNRAAFHLTNQTNNILLLNSDTKVTRHFAATMKRILYSSDDIGAVTARSNNATIWSVPMDARLANYRVLSYALHWHIKRKIPEKYITPTIHGFCVLIRRTVISAYGLFDEIYGKGYAEENDFAMRIRQHDWKCAVANGAYVFHFESKSFGNNDRKQKIDNNEKILINRYPEYRQLIQEYWDNTKEFLR